MLAISVTDRKGKEDWLFYPKLVQYMWAFCVNVPVIVQSNCTQNFLSIEKMRGGRGGGMVVVDEAKRTYLEKIT